jgi:heat shock protein HtpX
MNNLKTLILLSALTGILVIIGGSLGGPQGAIFAFGFAIFTNFFSYWNSAKIILKISKAKEISKEDNEKLFGMVEDIANKASMPVPRVYIIDSQQANAFATGRNTNHAAIAVTTGIMSQLTDGELRAVIGHEFAHIANRDILISTIVAAVAGAISTISWLSFWFSGRRGGGANIIVALVAPLAATIIQLAISRSREFQADWDGSKFSESPVELAAALTKIHNSTSNQSLQVPQATAHLYIANPLKSQLSGLFSTHPSLEQRIERLKKMRPDYAD